MIVILQQNVTFITTIHKGFRELWTWDFGNITRYVLLTNTNCEQILIKLSLFINNIHSVPGFNVDRFSSKKKYAIILGNNVNLFVSIFYYRLFIKVYFRYKVNIFIAPAHLWFILILKVMSFTQSKFSTKYKYSRT